jgi:hypothetical protein
MKHRKLLVVCSVSLSCICTSAFAEQSNANTTSNNKTSFYLSALYLQPSSNNLKYAVFVSGNQPYYQSWHNRIIAPGYSPAFDLGLTYAFQQTPYNVSFNWLHAGSSDSSSTQTSENTDINTVQFVAPPYDVGPAVFSIKHASSTASSSFNDIGIDFGKVFEYGSHLKGNIFCGLSILNINQTVTTTFSDNAGSPEIPGQAYALPADPRFYFTTKNSSRYFGAGPNIGMNVEYDASNGFGVLGQFAGLLTAGTSSAEDNFISSSQRLILLGNNPSTQQITTPNSTQLVPGLDSKLGVLYSHAWHNAILSIEGGYRFMYFYNAISTISPDTLVQAGVDPTVPEFATGTMAINSTAANTGPFSLQGPYLKFTITLA